MKQFLELRQQIVFPDIREDLLRRSDMTRHTQQGFEIPLTKPELSAEELSDAFVHAPRQPTAQDA